MNLKCFFRNFSFRIQITVKQVVNGLIESVRGNRGVLAEQQYVLVNNPEAEMLYEEFENKLAGWGISFVIDVPNDISSC